MTSCEKRSVELVLQVWHWRLVTGDIATTATNSSMTAMPWNPAAVTGQRERQSQTVTDSHRQSQTVTDSHRQIQTVTDSHRQLQAVTDSYRQFNCL